MPKVKRGVRLKIPYAAIIIDSQFLRDYVMRAAQFYLALGGMKTRSWSADTPIHEIAVDMDHALNDLLFENIVDEDTRAFLQSSCVDVQIETPQKEEATEKIEHEFVMKVSVSYFSIMSINFLDGLQKRNKCVYALVRKVLETLWAVPYAWINTQDSIHEQNEDFYGGWDEDDPEYSEMVEAMRVETELFKSHFAPSGKLHKKIPFRRSFLELKDERRRLAQSLTGKQRQWVDTALAVIEKALPLKRVDIDTFINPEVFGYEESTPVDATFSIVWSALSDLGQQHESQLNDYFGNYGGPVLFMRLNDRKSLGNARLYLDSLISLMRFFYQYSGIEKEVWGEP